jgi:hypothetical protein
MTWGSSVFTPYPSFMFWDGGPAGLVMRGWHLQPVFVYPRRRNADFKWTLDGDFLDQAVDFEDCVFADDSDDFLLVEVARRNKRILLGKEATINDVAAWARTGAKPIHRRFVRHPFVFHSGGASELRGIVAASQVIVDQIVARIDQSE